MSQYKLAAMGILAVVLLAAPANAGILENLQVKVGVSGVLPHESAKISTIGGDVRISDEVVPSLQLEYFFTDRISAELLCCIARHEVVAVGTALGRVDLGKVTHFPPTVTVKYRWTELGALQPYVGAGVNYTHFFDDKTPKSGPVTGISYGDSLGPALQAGADLRLDDHWALNFDVRKIWIHSNVKVSAGATRLKADVDIDPWVISSGVAYRF